MIEAVDIIRRLWAGGIVNHEGIFWRLKDAFLQIRPVQEKVPIYFGANSPRTLTLTGEVTDGWISTPLPPTLYEKRLKLVKKGAEK